MQTNASIIGVAIVKSGNSYLVGTRAQDTVLPGLHEFPGGKCDLGEPAADCAVRECLEETGIRVQVQNLLMRRQHTYDHGYVDLHFFVCVPETEPTPAPTGAFKWVPADQLANCRFPEANAEIIEALMAASE